MQGRKLQRNVKQTHIRPHLHTLVLLCCEFVGADGSHRDVGSYQRLVLQEEGEGVHPTEGRADHHHRAQAQLLTHLLQETCGGQFSNRCRGLGCLRPAESCGQTEGGRCEVKGTGAMLVC